MPAPDWPTASAAPRGNRLEGPTDGRVYHGSSGATGTASPTNAPLAPGTNQTVDPGRGVVGPAGDHPRANGGAWNPVRDGRSIVGPAATARGQPRSWHDRDLRSGPRGLPPHVERMGHPPPGPVPPAAAARLRGVDRGRRCRDARPQERRRFHGPPRARREGPPGALAPTNHSRSPWRTTATGDAAPVRAGAGGGHRRALPRWPTPPRAGRPAAGGSASGSAGSRGARRVMPRRWRRGRCGWPRWRASPPHLPLSPPTHTRPCARTVTTAVMGGPTQHDEVRADGAGARTPPRTADVAAPPRWPGRRPQQSGPPGQSRPLRHRSALKGWRAVPFSALGGVPPSTQRGCGWDATRHHLPFGLGSWAPGRPPFVHARPVGCAAGATHVAWRHPPPPAPPHRLHQRGAGRAASALRRRLQAPRPAGRRGVWVLKAAGGGDGSGGGRRPAAPRTRTPSRPASRCTRLVADPCVSVCLCVWWRLCTASSLSA